MAVARYGNEEHAMYVKKITKSFGNSLNSWGYFKAEPVLNAVTEVHQVHYISVISAQLPETEAARDRRIRGERMDAAPSSTPPAVSDLPIYEKDHSVPRAKAVSYVESEEKTPANDNRVEKSIISISQVDYMTKHWRVMVNNDSRCREVYKKSLNLKDKLVRAKLPPARNNTRPRRRERYRRMSPTLPICDEELSDSRVRTPSPAPSETNTDQQKVS